MNKLINTLIALDYDIILDKDLVRSNMTGLEYMKTQTNATKAIYAVCRFLNNI